MVLFIVLDAQEVAVVVVFQIWSCGILGLINEM